MTGRQHNAGPPLGHHPVRHALIAFQSCDCFNRGKGIWQVLRACQFSFSAVGAEPHGAGQAVRRHRCFIQFFLRGPATTNEVQSAGDELAGRAGHCADLNPAYFRTFGDASLQPLYLLSTNQNCIHRKWVNELIQSLTYPLPQSTLSEGTCLRWDLFRCPQICLSTTGPTPADHG